jgi:hypothetical protein
MDCPFFIAASVFSKINVYLHVSPYKHDYSGILVAIYFDESRRHSENFDPPL